MKIHPAAVEALSGFLDIKAFEDDLNRLHREYSLLPDMRITHEEYGEGDSGEVYVSRVYTTNNQRLGDVPTYIVNYFEAIIEHFIPGYYNNDGGGAEIYVEFDSKTGYILLSIDLFYNEVRKITEFEVVCDTENLPDPDPEEKPESDSLSVLPKTIRSISI